MSALEIQPRPAPIDTNSVPISPYVYTPDPNSAPFTAVREGFTFDQATVLSDSWTDEQALKIVLSDFDRAATYRQTNHEPRWQEAAELYLAYNPGRQVWEGTQTPRANMQVHLVFQQVEALIPQIVDAITGNDLDFDVEAARAGTTISQLHLVRDVMNYQFCSLGGTHTRFLGWREVVRRQVKDGLIFGNGINEWGWEGPYQIDETKWERQNFPEFAQIMHPMGFTLHAPTGNVVQRNVPVKKQRTVSQFYVDPCPIVDFYIDPNTGGPNPQEAEFGIRRKLMSVDELSKFRGKGDWKIPSDYDLHDLALKKQWTKGDTTRQIIAQAHGENLQPLEDFTLDGRSAKVEVYRFFNRGHHNWVFGREHVALNIRNQYGAIPFTNWSYVDVPNAFYAQSIPDICRTDQKLAKALIDGRLDEVNLMLHPPFITKTGTFRSQSQSKLRPGANFEAVDPQHDITRLEMGNVTQNAYTEVASLEQRVQAKTGVTDLATLGVPSSGGNSANRTATGVTAQTNASNTRSHYLIANYEDQVAQQLFDACWQLLREFLDPQSLMEIVGPDGQSLMVDPVDLLNADPRFVMKTAQRMKQRAGLQNGGLNTILQFFFNPEFAQLMSEEQGKVVDAEAISELVCDAFNIRAFNFFRPMTPQEQQAKQQRTMAPMQGKLAVQDARLKSMSADAHERDETTLIAALINGMAQAGLLNKVVGAELPIELEARKLDAEIAGGQYNAESANAR